MWEEERRERNRLWANSCPTPGCGRAETLKLLTDMVTKSEWKQEVDSHKLWEGDLISLTPTITLTILILYGLRIGLQAPNHREQNSH